MAQHDYVIDNSTGANVRADINNALQAIATNNSGSSAPSTTYAFQLFADTTNNVMKIRNSANNAFIELFQLDGTFTLEDGTNSAPALAFRDDLDTGIYSSADNTFNVATGGVERMELGTTTIFNEDGADVDFRIESDGNANMFFIDASANKIGFGTSTIVDGVFCFNSGTANGVANFISTDAGANISLTDTSARSTIEQNGTDLKITSDTDNADADSTIKFQVDGSTKMIINSSGNVGIGTTGTDHNLSIVAANSTTPRFGFINPDENENINFSTYHDSSGIYCLFGANMKLDASGNIGVDIANHRSGGILLDARNSGGLSFLTKDNSGTAVTTAMTIDSSGRLLIGVGNASHANTRADDLCVGNNDSTSEHGITIGSNVAGSIRWADSASGSAGTIEYVHSSDTMTFSTGGNIRMAIADSSGHVFIGASSFSSGSKVKQFEINPNAIATKSSASATSLQFHNEFHNSNGLVGSISTDGSGTSFNTSSDYRLKENIVGISDGITRLKTLKPLRFNFKVDKDTTVDGFLAHEVTSAVPEAITGTKDEVDSDNNPIYQGIDQSKLVPLLVAAVQELIGKVEALETA